MNLDAYRASASEQKRIASLISLMPALFKSGLDIGARDGYISQRMAERAENITALDLVVPNITQDKITCVKGDASALDFSNDSFDIVVCAEVLEHIPSPSLELACQEIARVTKKWAVIGVPLSQDLRFGATRCPSCRRTNPPWGHVNSFEVKRLKSLFPSMVARQTEFVGNTKDSTNRLSHALMEYAGHPFGTYSQDESCVFCGAKITYTEQRNFLMKMATRSAHVLNRLQKMLMPSHPMWVNILFEKMEP